jgi:hypothetical protein
MCLSFYDSENRTASYGNHNGNISPCPVVSIGIIFLEKPYISKRWEYRGFESPSLRQLLTTNTMRIKRYQIVSASDEEVLKTEVNKLIGEGWQPFFSPTVVPGSSQGDRRFLQAMVQYEGEIRM